MIRQFKFLYLIYLSLLPIHVAQAKVAEHQAPLYACPEAANHALINATQLVVVTTDSWNAVDAKMRFFSRASRNTPWIQNGQSQPAVVGKNGSAWGRNFAGLAGSADPIKHEGDGRTPVGIHDFGERFGFAPSANVPKTWHYVPLRNSTVCVDDPESVSYSKIVDANDVIKDWKSAEKMRAVSQYKIGIDIGYLTDRKAASGSCIFFHIWKGPHIGTTGCTAIDEAHMHKFQDWLQDEAHAAIAMVPKPAFAKFAACFDGFFLDDDSQL